ncbi:two-component response regulator ORR23-like [Nymphaea colorata]|uniref:two-component response regulator ORR23-like n=1 Tax=Nymphaea colorata TaxID=210225 RepID=UPI00129ED01E|nr:two-component response regulator ORR23-like [Nymphaea colorata]
MDEESGDPSQLLCMEEGLVEASAEESGDPSQLLCMEEGLVAASAEESGDPSRLVCMEGEGLVAASAAESGDPSQLLCMDEELVAALEDSRKDVRKATRVMVVESDRASLKEMESLMVQWDYDVTSVDNPITAVQMLKERKSCVDLVLSNIFMPEMDSLEFLEIVTNHLDLPVVFVSDNADQESLLKATLSGVKAVMLKPLYPHVLRNLWQHVLRHRKFKLRKRDPHGKAAVTEAEAGTASKQTAPAPESPPPSQKWKKRFIWTTDLKKKFAFAVDQLGFENATPSKILDIMGVTELTRKQIGSRLQKHRIYRRKREAEGKEHKDRPVSGGLGSSTGPRLANQATQPLPPTAVAEPQSGSLGPFTNMPSYYSSFRADDRRGLGTYGLMKSTDPASVIGRAPSFMQEQRHQGNESVLQNPPMPSFMQEQRNQGDESIFQNPYIAQSGYDPTSTMWSSSSNLNHGDHELLPFHGYAFGQQAANNDQLNLASTSHFGVAPGSNTGLMVDGFQFDGQHAGTSAVISHNMHEQSTGYPLAAFETGSEGINQIFQCAQNELPGLSNATQPFTSPFGTDPMNSTHISLGMHDMPITPLPGQMQNLGDLYGNANSYLDNMNARSSINTFSDLERMLNDLIVPPESQLQPSDLDSFFPVDDQDYGPDNGTAPPDQLNQEAIAFITSTLSQEVLVHVPDECSAKELWDKLVKTYSQILEASISCLQREFHRLSKVLLPIMEHLNWIISTFDQLAARAYELAEKDEICRTLGGWTWTRISCATHFTTMFARASSI